MKRITTILIIASCGFVNADDWPQFRGANQDGISKETGWTTKWSRRGPKMLWDAEIGQGSATVSVVGDRVYTMGTVGETNEADTVFCLNAKTGKVVWKHTYARVERKGRTPTRRGPANSTPTVHDGKVYTCSGDAQLFCFNAADGNIVWQRDLMKELGALHPQYDHDASPVIVDDLLILPIRLKDASILAFNKRTGKEVWRAYHRTRRGALGGFWSTPVLRTIDGKRCLVYLTGLAVVGLNPTDGKTLWKYDFVKTGVPKAERGAVAVSAVVDGNRVFFPFHPDHGRGFSGCIEINDGKPKLLWKSMKLAHWWFNPVKWNGHVIALDQGPAAQGTKAGALYCYDLATGKLKWSTYDIGGKSRNTVTKGAKLMIADGKLIVLNNYGGLTVASISEKGLTSLGSFKAIRRQGGIWTVPVLANGRLYCRSGRGRLYCYDLRKSP